MKLMEVPPNVRTLTYPTADPNVILAHQLPDPRPPSIQMLEETTNLMHSLFCLHPAEIDSLLDDLAGKHQGTLGSIRRIAELLKAEHDRAAQFVRPAYFYADEKYPG